MPGTKPALQTLPETFLTKAFALCQKWQDWALDVLFGPSVAACIVSSDGFQVNLAWYVSNSVSPLGPCQQCCYMKTVQIGFSSLCPGVSQPWPIDLLGQIILCCGELSCALQDVCKHPWFLPIRWRSFLSTVVPVRNVSRHCPKFPGEGHAPPARNHCSAHVRIDYFLCSTLVLLLNHCISSAHYSYPNNTFKSSK